MPTAPTYLHTDTELVDLDDDRLRKLPNNPNRGDVIAAAKSLARFGQRDPLVVRRLHGNRGEIEAGNHRLDAVHLLRGHVKAITGNKGRKKAQAALDARQQLGQEAAERLMDDIEHHGDQAWSQVTVLWVDDDEDEGLAYALASNRTARLGHDDPELLVGMLKQIAAHERGLIEAAGYTDHDLHPVEQDPANPTDPDPPPPRERTTSALPRQDDEHDATSTRTLVLPMNVAVHAWTTSQLAQLRRHHGFDTDTHVLVWLLEQATGGTAPRDSPGLHAQPTEEP